MKIRDGFVSNSSSSSFIVNAHKVGFNDIKINDNRYFAIGRELSDGVDIIRVHSELEIAMLYYKKEFFEFYCEDEHSEKLEIERDQHNSYDYENYKCNYNVELSEDEILKHFQKSFRTQKLNRILDED